MLQEFKTFALRGNVVDLAIGVIIGHGRWHARQACTGTIVETGSQSQTRQ